MCYGAEGAPREAAEGKFDQIAAAVGGELSEAKARFGRYFPWWQRRRRLWKSVEVGWRL